MPSHLSDIATVDEDTTLLTSAKRCRRVASVLLPAPVAPTSATVSPG